MLKGKTHPQLIKLASAVIQPLLPSFHKGQAGKIAIIGGCLNYTGAPYFAAHSAASIGADLTHIISDLSSAPVIKTYSPDLMVHPYLRNLNDIPHLIHEIEHLSLSEALGNEPLLSYINSTILPPIMSLLSRIDLVVVGPGFGRDIVMLTSLHHIIEKLKLSNTPLILDADALYLLSQHPNLVKDYPGAIITPNFIEFKRIADHFNIDTSNLLDAALKLNDLLNVNIILKGEQDIIVFNKNHLINSSTGSLKRVGGQGDTLVGTLATLTNWSINYSKKLWSHENDLSPDEAKLLAAYSASVLVRLASNKAFAKYGRSMQTSDVHKFLSESFNDLFPDITDAN